MLPLCTLFIPIFITITLASPVPSKKGIENGRILYDQRQEGEWNVRADLKNFVILIIPTSQGSPTSPTPPTLLDFLTKSAHHKRPIKRNHHQQHNKIKDVAETQETQHFIESKTAPYHVDITKSRSHLSKVHSEPEVINAEEIVIAKSPTISLLKDEIENVSRDNRAFIVTVPTDVIKKDEKKKDKKKEVQKQEMKLLGAENEQCGPGLERDSSGICRTIKN